MEVLCFVRDLTYTPLGKIRYIPVDSQTVRHCHADGITPVRDDVGAGELACPRVTSDVSAIISESEPTIDQHGLLLGTPFTGVEPVIRLGDDKVVLAPQSVRYHNTSKTSYHVGIEKLGR